MPAPIRRPEAHPSWPESPGGEVERAWISRIAAGDEAAFETLFHAYHARLCAFAYRYVGAHDLAEEMVQEVFLFIWDRRETWDVRTSLKSYLFAAVRNAALSYLRHERVVRRHDAETVELFTRPTPSTDSEVRTTELVAAVQRAVNRLPERCRLVFTLHREQALTYAEIAEVLAISPKTVEVQMGRALKTLRKALAGFLSIAVLTLLR
jgi:RNA polymerase sigma-70 factor (ECF subfamily)